MTNYAAEPSPGDGSTTDAVRSSSETKLTVLGAAAGLISACAILVAFLLPSGVPNLSALPSTIDNYFTFNLDCLIATAIIESGAALLLIVFVAQLYRTLSDSSEPNNSRTFAPLVLISGTIFIAVAFLASIFTAMLSITNGQLLSNANAVELSSLDLVSMFVLRSVVGTGLFEMAGAIFILAIGLALRSARMVGRSFIGACIALAICSAGGGGAALALGNYSQFWTVVQNVSVFAIAGVIILASAILVVRRFPIATTVSDGDRESSSFARKVPRLRIASANRRTAAIFMGVGVVVAACILVPLVTHGNASSLATATGSSEYGGFAYSTSPGSYPSSNNIDQNGNAGSNAAANIGGDDNSQCSPTTDPSTSGGAPSSIENNATEVAHGQIEGSPWSLWSVRGETGATALENAGLVWNNKAYGLCPGYPNPSETEMIATSGNGIIYGVVGYSGRATVNIYEGMQGSFSTGNLIVSPPTQVVNGVAFYIAALPKSACSYSYFEVNSVTSGIGSQHNIGFGGLGAGEGYSISDNAGNDGACTAGKLDPLSYSQGEWSEASPLSS